MPLISFVAQKLDGLKALEQYLKVRMEVPNNENACSHNRCPAIRPCQWLQNNVRITLVSYGDALSTNHLYRLVPQLSSVGPLLVSEPAFRKLSTSLKAFPAILDVVHAFGRKVGDEERSGLSIADRMGLENGKHGTLKCYTKKILIRVND